MTTMTLSRVVALTLLHSVWQLAVVGALHAVSMRLLRRAPSASRYLVACAALGAMAIVPLATLLLEARAELAMVSPHAAALARAPATFTRGQATSLVVSALWVLGVLAMSARLVGGAARLRNLSARAAWAPPAWQAMADALAERLGVRRAVQVMASLDVDVPMVLGFLRPVLLVPASIGCSLPPAALEAILAHELAHIRRHDFLVNLVQSSIETLLFFHPSVFLVSRRIREERELACDDAAVLLLGDPVSYARALVSLESTRHTEPLAIGAAGGSLMTRIHHLLQRPLAPSSTSRVVATLTVGLALVACVTLPLLACGTAAKDEPLGQQKSATSATGWLPESVSRWQPELAAAGLRHGVAPDLLAIVTLLESRGDPAAKSPIGAVGLMQLMPPTAARIAEGRHLPAVTEGDLEDPALNIDFGAFYLAEQLKTFATDGDEERSIELAAAAYNAGPDSVHAFLDEGRPLPEETVRYKNRVVALWRAHHAADPR